MTNNWRTSAFNVLFRDFAHGRPLERTFRPPQYPRAARKYFHLENGLLNGTVERLRSDCLEPLPWFRSAMFYFASSKDGTHTLGHPQLRASVDSTRHPPTDLVCRSNLWHPPAFTVLRSHAHERRTFQEHQLQTKTQESEEDNTESGSRSMTCVFNRSKL